jgi:predicted nucleic acid-binding protein
VRALLDACVLVPSVQRGLLLGAAAAGGFAPLWSARILEEWARAARRLPGLAEAEARAGIAEMRARWPEAEVPPDPELEAALALPDPGDVHVLAAAIAGQADTLVTRNRADFPTRVLARHGLILRDPDGLLLELHAAGLPVATLAEAARSRGAAGEGPGLRPFLKRAGLPRLGKALAGAG